MANDQEVGAPTGLQRMATTLNEGMAKAGDEGMALGVMKKDQLMLLGLLGVLGCPST